MRGVKHVSQILGKNCTRIVLSLTWYQLPVEKTSVLFIMIINACCPTTSKSYQACLCSWQMNFSYDDDWSYIASLILFTDQIKPWAPHHTTHNSAQELSQIRLDLVFGVYEYKTSPLSSHFFFISSCISFQGSKYFKKSKANKKQQPCNQKPDSFEKDLFKKSRINHYTLTPKNILKKKYFEKAVFF